MKTYISTLVRMPRFYDNFQQAAQSKDWKAK